MKIFFQIFLCAYIFLFSNSTGIAQVSKIEININQNGVESCIASSVQSTFPEQSINVYPNPTDGIISIKFNTLMIETSLNIEVRNLDDQVLFNNKLIANELENEQLIDLTEFPTGSYIVSISNQTQYYLLNVIVK